MHAMAESVSASEQPECAEALFRHDTCDASVIETGPVLSGWAPFGNSPHTGLDYLRRVRVSFLFALRWNLNCKNG